MSNGVELARLPVKVKGRVRDGQKSYDAVVIGSGPGGLTAAVALARAGQRVLVLEQHYLPGGWMHSFTLEGYRFSPGVHYIGDLGRGSGLRNLYESFGLSKHLEFFELNQDGFDHFMIEGQRFDQPKGLNRWKSRLKASFPHEAAGIDRYFGVLQGVVKELTVSEHLLGFPEVLTLPFKAPNLFKWSFRTLSALLEKTIKDPMLRAVLSAQVGNHGCPPSKVSLPMHACMSAHYFEGGYYPRGGAKRIAAAYIKVLRSLGGEIRMESPVTRIVVEHGKAVGVEVKGEIIRAGQIVCNADPAVTYGRLLPKEYCEREVAKVARTKYSVSSVSLFCGVDMDLRGMGYDSGNYWYYRTRDVNGAYERAEQRLPEGPLDALFLAITSLKDPGHRRGDSHTVEMFTFAPYEAFAEWRGSSLGERGGGYDALKGRVADQMLAAAEHIIPGIREKVSFLSIGTPLTNTHYCEAYQGAMYGSSKSRWQLGPFGFSSRGPVENLHLCGASILSHGIAGASMSGLMAAKTILGAADLESLVGPGDGSLRITDSESYDEETSGVRILPSIPPGTIHAGAESVMHAASDALAR